MALSSVSYVADGVAQTFSLTFNYLAQSHVTAFVDGVEDTTFTWATSSTITLSTVPVATAIVLIKRTTPTAPLVDFVDGSNLTEALLDTATQQALFVVEESSDALGGTMQVDALTNEWDATSLVIKNVATPVTDDEAVNKGYTDTVLTAAAASAAAALVSQNAAAASALLADADATQTAADRIAVAADLALTDADTIATAADRVQTGLDATATAADKVATNADVLLTGADVTTTNADAVTTTADALATGADAIATAADATQTAIDAAATAADLVQTAADVVICDADVVLCEAAKDAAEAAALGAGGFPAGTRMLFNQSAAPVGWTKDTTAALNDTALRIVTGTVGSGGTNAYSTVMSSSTTDGHTLTTAEMPSHRHTQEINGTSSVTPQKGTGAYGDVSSNTGYTGGGGSHSHGITLDMKYNDVILASKD